MARKHLSHFRVEVTYDGTYEEGKDLRLIVDNDSVVRAVLALYPELHGVQVRVKRLNKLKPDFVAGRKDD